MANSIAEAAFENLKKAGLGDALYLPDNEKYSARISSYWSLTPQLRPWAIVQPKNTQEVSTALKTLVGTEGCQIAIRSGGHMSWVGANNIEDGITIDLGLMSATTYNPETKLASLSPGARWTDVYAYLEERGVMVAGGREGLVGVGGLLVGGGKTYYTCRVGFACDQVMNYEVVLADGSIVEANEKTNPDLFRVLKGGSNNFGIVTRFDMVTFEAKPIWDGVMVYPKTATPQLLDHFYDFTKMLHDYPDAHFLGGWMYEPQVKDIFVMAIMTHLDGAEKSKSFEKFLDIPGQQQLSRVTTVSKKVAEFLLPSNQHDIWYTLTFKLDKRTLTKVGEVYERVVGDLKGIYKDGNFVSRLMLQPLPSTFIQHSVARGGNMFGLDRVKDDCVLFMCALQVPTKEDVEAGSAVWKAAVDEIDAYATSIGGHIDFRYLNYCDGSQNPLSTYGEENIKKMKDAAAKYDPTEVFQKRVPGGFKISKI